MLRRGILVICASLLISSCESHFVKTETLAGEYRAAWSDEVRLILNDDRTYLMRTDTSESSVGQWYLPHYFGDVSINMNDTDGFHATYDVRRSILGTLSIVLDARRNRTLVKVADV